MGLRSVGAQFVWSLVWSAEQVPHAQVQSLSNLGLQHLCCRFPLSTASLSKQRPKSAKNKLIKILLKKGVPSSLLRSIT